MPLLLILLELFVGTLAVWVFTFEISIYLRLATRSSEIVFLLSWMLMLMVVARPWRQRLRVMSRKERAFALNTLTLGCLTGFLVLVASRPDADDIGYMHQALVDISTPDHPFTIKPFIVPFRGARIEIPFLSEYEAYEAMVAAIADMAGIEPLQAYHNVFAFFSAIIWTVTYALLFRRFRIPRNKVWLSLLLTVTFLLLDGNLHRTFGNFTLIRIWQGKVIAVSILVPAFMHFSLRFLSRPKLYRFCLLLATGMACFFLNRSTVFVLAVLGTSIGIGYLLVFKMNFRRAVRVGALGTATLPLWAICAYVGLSSLPSGSLSPSAFSEAAPRAWYGSSWWSSLYLLVIGSRLALARDFLFLMVLPVLAVPRPLNRFLPAVSLAVAILALSPLTGPAWYYLISTVYWRLYYALPLPLCTGLVVHLVTRRGSRRRSAARLALAGVLVLATGFAVDRPVLSAANDVQFKHPFEYRFRDLPLAFARSVAPRVENKHVLAPSEIAIILALTRYDSIELAFTRSASRRSNALRADRAVSSCKVDGDTVEGVTRLLERGVDAIIMSSCNDAVMRRFRGLLPGYRLVEEEEVAAFGYRLYWVFRDSDPPTPPN